MARRGTTLSHPRLKRLLRKSLSLGLRSMLNEIGKKGCFGHGPMRLLDATCVIGLPDGTSVKVRATTKTLASLTSGMQQPTSPSSSPTNFEVPGPMIGLFNTLSPEQQRAAL